jgi:hypothetical protein
MATIVRYLYSYIKGGNGGSGISFALKYKFKIIVFYTYLNLHKYVYLMMACLGRNKSSELIKYKIVLFDEVYVLFHFNIMFKHNGMSSTKIKILTPCRFHILVSCISKKL